MSGILSGLRQYDGDGHPATVSYNEALDDVREALLNPTDEQRATAGKALYEAVTRDAGIEPAEWVLLRPKTRRMYEQAARAVLATAGGDDA